VKLESGLKLSANRKQIAREFLARAADQVGTVKNFPLVVVVVQIFVHGAVKATVTNVPQSQLNKWLFSSFLNCPTVVSDWRSEAGRVSQSLGPAT